VFASVKGKSEAKPSPADAPPGSASWWRHRYRTASAPRRRARVDGLTLEAITEATLRIIDGEGLPAVTMRRIAEELGTGAASLYRHVASREELLVLVADQVFDFPAPPADRKLGWRKQSELTARRYRKFLLGKPAAVALLNQAQLLGPSSLRGREVVLERLIGQGFPPELAVRTYLTLTHYVIGSIHVDDRSAKRDPRERRALISLFRELDAEQFPTVVDLADVLGGLSPDDEFEFGLQALLDGIAAALQRATDAGRS
jgi:AcrR family transcriptional regulator